SLASTLPGETMIGGESGDQPRWPYVVANVADHSVLPVPDASAFEPDAGTSEDVTDVHSPAPAEAKQAPRATKQEGNHPGRAQKRKDRIVHASKDQRRAEHAHRHKLTHTSADRQNKKRRNTANNT